MLHETFKTLRKLFNTSAISKPETESEAKAVQFYSTHCQRIENIKQLSHLPAEGEALFLWTIKSFNAFTFIPYLLTYYDRIQSINISTYTVNRKILDALVNLLDTGAIEKISLFVSDSLKFRMPKVTDHLQALISSRPNLEVIYAWNHSKITCIHCGDDYYVIEGSGNWGENAQFEQYLFIRSKEVYEFRNENFKRLNNGN